MYLKYFDVNHIIYVSYSYFRSIRLIFDFKTTLSGPKAVFANVGRGEGQLCETFKNENFQLPFKATFMIATFITLQKFNCTNEPSKLAERFDI